MANQVTITSVSGLTPPFSAYCCNVYGNQCVYVGVINSLPDTILLPPQFNTAPAVGLLLIDPIGCERFEEIYCILPTPCVYNEWEINLGSPCTFNLYDCDNNIYDTVTFSGGGTYYVCSTYEPQSTGACAFPVSGITIVGSCIPSPTPTPTPTPTPIPLSAFTVTLLEVGSDVVMSGYGGFNILDLTYVATNGYGAVIDPQTGVFLLGSSPSNLDLYTGSTFNQPTNFGGPPTGATINGSIDTLMGVFPVNNLAVPTGYISGSYIEGSTTYFNQTLSSLGATPGIYIYSWGSGVNSSILTLQVGP